jgi:hypothetical protein
MHCRGEPCLRRKLSSAPGAPGGQASVPRRRPASSFVRRSITSGAASTAPARRSRRSPLDSAKPVGRGSSSGLRRRGARRRPDRARHTPHARPGVTTGLPHERGRARSREPSSARGEAPPAGRRSHARRSARPGAVTPRPGRLPRGRALRRRDRLGARPLPARRRRPGERRRPGKQHRASGSLRSRASPLGRRQGVRLAPPRRPGP